MLLRTLPLVGDYIQLCLDVDGQKPIAKPVKVVKVNHDARVFSVKTDTGITIPCRISGEAVGWGFWRNTVAPVNDWLVNEPTELVKNQAEAVKHDDGKPPMELLATGALREVAKVMGAGAKKYGRHNWRKGMDWTRLHGAALRHIFAHLDGEDRDPETGLSHLAHAMCCMMFLLEYEQSKLGTDDRHTTRGAS